MRRGLGYAIALLALVWLPGVAAGSAAASGGASILPAACAAAPVAGTADVALAVDRLHRTARVHVPPGLTAEAPTPLLLVLHGYRGSGVKMERYTGFSGLADRYGFSVAYPNSAGTFWNSNGVRGLPDDVHFLARLIAYLKQKLCVDPDRVFLAGVSNGGGMAALAACRLSTQVSAFVSVAGGYDGQPPCRPQSPESVLEIHGTADPVVPYFGQTRRRTSDGLPPFVNSWVARDRCRGRPAVSAFARRATAFSWAACASGVRVEHVRISGGRHQWPGANPPDPGPPATFCGACAVWRFLAAVPVDTRSWGRRP